MIDTKETIYTVVVNDEGQYSLWRADSQIPAGWRAAGKEGPKEDCLEYSGRVWTDIRPASTRKALEA